MSAQKFGLLSIANAKLAEKLSDDAIEADKATNSDNGNGNDNSKNKEDNATINQTQGQDVSFKHDKWLALTLLNIFRYAFAIIVLALILFHTNSVNSVTNLGNSNPFLFRASIFCLLFSSIGFTLLSKRKNLPFDYLITMQLIADVVLTGLIVYSCGGITSKYVILYFLIVATGSVVLSQRAALGLASGCIIALFYQHFHNQLAQPMFHTVEYSLLVILSIGLFITALLVSYLALRIQQAERQAFIPGSENIEDYLKREEKSALLAALKATAGNKTNAAKLLGMTFRSFRYKLSKHDID